jgi:hypothetical protein
LLLFGVLCAVAAAEFNRCRRPHVQSANTTSHQTFYFHSALLPSHRGTYVQMKKKLKSKT